MENGPFILPRMNRDEALQALAQVEQQMQAKIPTEAPSWGRRHLKHVIDEHVGAARLHLTLIYDQGCAVGPGFTPLPAHAAHPKYAFWTEGVQRHLEICAANIEGRPDEQGVD
jgi:hypothetical protein